MSSCFLQYGITSDCFFVKTLLLKDVKYLYGAIWCLFLATFRFVQTDASRSLSDMTMDNFFGPEVADADAKLAAHMYELCMFYTSASMYSLADSCACGSLGLLQCFHQRFCPYYYVQCSKTTQDAAGH